MDHEKRVKHGLEASTSRGMDPFRLITRDKTAG
jgi:hypothetical protein